MSVSMNPCSIVADWVVYLLISPLQATLFPKFSSAPFVSQWISFRTRGVGVSGVIHSTICLKNNSSRSRVHSYNHRSSGFHFAHGVSLCRSHNINMCLTTVSNFSFRTRCPPMGYWAKASFISGYCRLPPLCFGSLVYSNGKFISHTGWGNLLNTTILTDLNGLAPCTLT